MWTEGPTDRQTDGRTDMTDLTIAFYDRADAPNSLSRCLKLFAEIIAVFCNKCAKHKKYVSQKCKLFGRLLKLYALYNKNQMPKIFWVQNRQWCKLTDTMKWNAVVNRLTAMEMQRTSGGGHVAGCLWSRGWRHGIQVSGWCNHTFPYVLSKNTMRHSDILQEWHTIQTRLTTPYQNWTIRQHTKIPLEEVPLTTKAKELQDIPEGQLKTKYQQYSQSKHYHVFC
jgi:hypothetical protein